MQAIPRLPRRLAGALCLSLFLFSAAAARAQDEKKEQDPEAVNRAATQKLLKRAEEEYRLFFKRPEQPHEFWAAAKYEISVGKFDLAALHLKFLVEKEPKEDVDKELVKIEAAEGMSSFLRLRNVRTWSDHPPFQQEAEKSVDEVIDRVTKAVERHLGDPARLKRFVNQLNAASPEERAFAFVQLQRSKARAVPYLIDALRVHFGRPLGRRIHEALLRLDPEIVPAFLEVFKAHDLKDAGDEIDLRVTLLNVVKQRDDKRAIPYLWHLANARQYPDLVRTKALETLASLMQTDATRLPPAKAALTSLAERYYQHKVQFVAGRPVAVWPWDGERIALKPIELTPRQAEEFFGLRYAREALDLDPAYVPAQNVLLSLMLERTYDTGLDKALLNPPPAGLQNLLATVDADLLMQVLERALTDHRPAVAIPVIRALGDRGEFRAARVNSGGEPRGVVRALHYPDRRVQFAAVGAMLKMPASTPPVAGPRIVEVLRRFIATDGTPRALAAYVPPDLAPAVRAAVKGAGLEPVLVRDVNEAFERLRESADYDLILLHRGLPATELPFVLTQLRGDADLGLLPVLVVPAKDRQDEVQRAVDRYLNVHVLPEAVLAQPEDLKTTVDKHVVGTRGPALTAAERKEYGRTALDILWRMARNEIPGYDVRPAQEAVVAAVRNPDHALLALEILGRLPGTEAQQRLAAVATDPARGKLRVPAAAELHRHIQKHGLLLQKRQVEDLRLAHTAAADDPALRAPLALVVGTLRSTAQQTGTQLYQFRPDPPPPPAEKEKKEAP